MNIIQTLRSIFICLVSIIAYSIMANIKLISTAIRIGIYYLFALIALYFIYFLIFLTSHDFQAYLGLLGILAVYTVILIGVLILVAYSKFSSESRFEKLIDSINNVIDEEMFAKGKAFEITPKSKKWWDLNLKWGGKHE